MNESNSEGGGGAPLQKEFIAIEQFCNFTGQHYNYVESVANLFVIFSIISPPFF